MADIEIKFDYDKEADVLYISFGTGEPSYCEEVDDILLVERGFVTNNITGFRILDIKYHKIQKVEISITKILKILKQEKYPPRIYFDTLRQRLQPNQLKNVISS